MEFDGSFGNLLELSGLFASMHNLEIVPCFFMSCIPCEVFHLFCIIHQLLNLGFHLNSHNAVD